MITDDFVIGPKLGDLVDRVVASYNADSRTQHIDRLYLPSQAQIVTLVQDLLELLYPGFVGRQHLTRHNVAFHVGDLLPRIGDGVFKQIHMCLCYAEEAAHPGLPPAVPLRSAQNLLSAQDLGSAQYPPSARHPQSARPRSDSGGQQALPPCDAKARDLTLTFLEAIPEIRDVLGGDVQAAYDGDPAALNLDEVLLAYPGLLAISIHRLAHGLYKLVIPLMPRMMSEWAHARTGIDIHPGARIGRNFFIDHGTGVVIGETADIGENVKIYQGVTLGALSFPKDERGRVIRKTKRHPTVKDNVTIYANAIILGGNTVIGENSIVGGSVFVTSSVPPNSVVTFKPPELRLKTIPDSEGAPSTFKPKDAKTESLPDYAI